MRTNMSWTGLDMREIMNNIWGRECVNLEIVTPKNQEHLTTKIYDSRTGSDIWDVIRKTIFRIDFRVLRWFGHVGCNKDRLMKKICEYWSGVVIWDVSKKNLGQREYMGRNRREIFYRGQYDIQSKLYQHRLISWKYISIRNEENTYNLENIGVGL